MAQTTYKSYVHIPNGGVFSIKASGDSTFTDVGAIESGINAVLQWDESVQQYGNAEDDDIVVKDMRIEGDFVLNNLDPDGIEKLSSGLFEKVTTASAAISTIPDQTIAASWVTKTPYELRVETSSTDDTLIKTSAAPTLTSVTLDPDGTPEVLVADEEYFIIADDNSYSGWSIVFVAANMETADPTTLPIEIDYGSNAPIASTTLHMGRQNDAMTPFECKITHTDDNSLVREFYIYKSYIKPGAFNFGVKGANEDGRESMPISFIGKLDTTRTAGRQLAQYLIQNGAA